MDKDKYLIKNQKIMNKGKKIQRIGVGIIVIGVIFVLVRVLFHRSEEPIDSADLLDQPSYFGVIEKPDPIQLTRAFNITREMYWIAETNRNFSVAHSIGFDTIYLDTVVRRERNGWIYYECLSWNNDDRNSWLFNKGEGRLLFTSWEYPETVDYKYYDGKIDEVYFIKRELDSAEIELLHKGTPDAILIDSIDSEGNRWFNGEILYNLSDSFN